MKYDIDSSASPRKSRAATPIKRTPRSWGEYEHAQAKDPPTPPTPPDPYQTANAQTQSNIQTANNNAALNRVNYNTPWGSLTYSRTPGQAPAPAPAPAGGASTQVLQQQPGGYYAPQPGDEHYNPTLSPSGSQAGNSGPQAGAPAQGGGSMSPDQWSANIALSPEQQKLLDSQNRLQLSMGNTANNQMDRVSQMLSSPVDFSGAPKRVTNVGYGHIQNDIDMSGVPSLIGGDRLADDLQTQRDALYGQQQAFLDPQWENRQRDLQNTLTQQGVMQNSEAWNRAMDDFNRQRSFDYNNARSSAITGGGAEQSRLFDIGLASNQNAFGQATTRANFHNAAQSQGFGQGMANANLKNSQRQAAINEILAQRETPLNELNSLRTGSQVTAPQFPTAPQVNIPGTDIAGLISQNYANEMGGYNAAVAGNNSVTGGLFGLGAAALMGPFKGIFGKG